MDLEKFCRELPKIVSFEDDSFKTRPKKNISRFNSVKILCTIISGATCSPKRLPESRDYAAIKKIPC